MKSTFQTRTKHRVVHVSAAFCLLVGLLWASGLRAQTPEEHASHHPGQAGGATPPGSAAPAEGAMPASQATADGGVGTAPAATSGGMGGSAGGGMGDMMDGMMKKMGVPPPQDIYPTVMSLPELSPDQREQVRVQANERMRSGVALLSAGMDQLALSTENEDYAAMQEATARMREALAGFESGVAARRALAEGQPPRQVALQWFKSEMNLRRPQGVEARSGLFGVSPFHLFTMVLLVAFALAMVAMYYFKMRRAAALFGRIESDSGSPLPGSAPPLAGTAPSPVTPADKPAAEAKETSA